MENYEALLIYKPTINYEQVKQDILELLIQKLIPECKMYNLGVQNLAYEKQGFKQGHYISFIFTGSLYIHDELLKCFKVDPNVLSSVIVAPGDLQDLSNYEHIILSNKLIDAVDVLLGMKSYVQINVREECE